MLHHNQTTESMARLLRDAKVDLGDERAIFRALAQAHFIHGDIVAFAGDAAKLAAVEPTSPKPSTSIVSDIGDALIVVFAVGVWLAWYVVLCPAVS